MRQTREQDIKQGEPLTDRQQREYEWIDATRFKGMMLAERKCRKLRAGYVEWSPQFQQAMDTHRYWYLVLLRWDGHKVSARRLIRMAKKLNLGSPSNYYHARQMERESAEEYQRQKKKAKSVRGLCLHDLAVARAEAGYHSAATAVQVMQRRERVKRDHRIINFVIKDAKTALTEVQSTTDGFQSTHRTKTGIETAGLQEFEARL